MRALIADDEEGPREHLRSALTRLCPQVRIVAVCNNGADAWDEALSLEPEVCFLDIRMPGLSGLEVGQRLSRLAQPPQMVFVTAYNDHALEAFDAGAIDYLVKPLDDERFQRTLTRLQQRIGAQALAPDLHKLLQGLLPKPRNVRPLQAGVGKEVRLIQPEDVVYFESDARYTRVITANAEALIRTPLKELIGQLDSEVFWQIHRSVLVNSRHIASAQRVDENTMYVTLKGRAEKLPVSRQFQGLFRGQ